jgi:hypothetical protein
MPLNYQDIGKAQTGQPGNHDSDAIVLVSRYGETAAW